MNTDRDRLLRLTDIEPGQLFAWRGGIFVKTDKITTRSDYAKNNGPMVAVTVLKKTIPTVSGLPVDSNTVGATVWMALNMDVVLLTADIYLGDRCIHRMWENQVD